MDCPEGWLDPAAAWRWGIICFFFGMLVGAYMALFFAVTKAGTKQPRSEG